MDAAAHEEKLDAFGRFSAAVSDETLAALPPRQQERLLRRAVWQLTWPVIAEQSLMTLVQIVSMAMVGRLGPEAIAASGLSNYPFMLISSTFMGLSVGTTALVARFFGAGDRRGAERTLQQSLLVGAVFGVLVAIAGTVYAKPIIGMMGAAPDVAALGEQYVRSMAPGLAFMIILTMISAGLRGAGDTRTPMVVNVLVNLANVAFGWPLIFGRFGLPSLGIVGAGLAATLARALGGVLMLGLLVANRLTLYVSWRRLLAADFPLLRRLLKVGLPSGAERLITSFGQLLYVRQVAGLGTIAYATHSLGMNIESLSWMPGIGFSTAASTLVGLTLGARRPVIAERSTIATLRMAFWVMGLMGFLFFAIPTVFLRIYTDNAQIISIGSTAMKVLGVNQLAQAAAFVYAGGLRGAGDTRSVLIITTLGTWGVRLGMTPILLHLGWGLTGAWMAMFADQAFRALASYWVFRRGKWKSVEV